MLKSDFFDSKDLIIKSEFIFTITGTVGWEGILLNKPVIVFGKVFYEHFPGVIKFENWDLIADYIEKARNLKIMIKMN